MTIRFFYGKLSRNGRRASDCLRTCVLREERCGSADEGNEESVLVRRGKELHGPDKMYLKRGGISCWWSRVTPGIRKWAKLIEQSEKKKNRREKRAERSDFPGIAGPATDSLVADLRRCCGREKLAGLYL